MLQYYKSLLENERRSRMFDEFGKEDDNWRPEAPKYRRYIFKAFSILFIAFVFFLIALMVYRLISSKPPASMKEMVWNDAAVAAYGENGEGFEVNHIMCSDSFSDEGMFSVSMITYSPTIKQLQMTVRYNDRVLNYLEEDYPGAKELEGEKYVFVIRDDHDNIYTSYSYTRAERTGYTYRHLIFENVTFEDVNALTLDVYYINDADFSEDARHSMKVYRYDYAVLPYELGKQEAGKYEIFTYDPQNG